MNFPSRTFPTNPRENFVRPILDVENSNDFQVPPAELEMLILQHECVESVGVVGVPDEAAGELPRAYVLKKPGTDVTEEDILHYVSGKFDEIMIRYLRFLENDED